MKYIVHGRNDAVNHKTSGQSLLRIICWRLKPGNIEVVRLRRLSARDEASALSHLLASKKFSRSRMKEADEFYDAVIPSAPG